MKTRILKTIVVLVCMMTMLAFTACRTQYHCPGGFKNRRIPAKGCGCPSYSWISPINANIVENNGLICFFDKFDRYHAVDTGGFSGSEVLR